MVDARHHPDLYRGAVLKLNMQEAADFLNDRAEDFPIEKARQIGQRISKQTGKAAFLTRGERGILVADGDRVHEIPGILIHGKTDPVGAGDSVVAAIAAGLSSGLSPEQTHPGFSSMEDALDFVDWEASADPYILDKYRLVPQPVADRQQRGQGEEMWVFPPSITHKFSGTRVRVTGSVEMIEQKPYAMLIWEGAGELNGKPVRAGDEFFIAEEQARVPHRLTNTGTDRLEAFKFFPPEP